MTCYVKSKISDMHTCTHVYDSKIAGLCGKQQNMFFYSHDYVKVKTYQIHE